jgi:hypothetical protein
VGPIFATLSCFTHTTPHPIFSQSERVEASSSPAQLHHKYGRIYSFHWLYFTYLYPQFQWTYKIHASLPHRLITVTFITQRPHHLRSLALLLSLSLALKRLHSHGTPVMALGLKSTNHSCLRSPVTHVTFSQTLSLSLYHLLLSSSQTLK